MQAIAVNQGIAIGQTGTAVQAGMSQGGDFMQLIMQMMGQNPDGIGALMEQTAEGTDTSGLEELLGLSGEEEDDEENSDYLMQLMAGMLAHGTPQIAMYNGAEQTEAAMNGATFADVVKAGASHPIWSTAAQSGLPTPVEGTATPDGKVTPFQSVLGDSSDMPVEILSETYNPTAQSVVPKQGDVIQNAFAGANRQQTGQLAEGKKSETVLDIDALQQVVDSGKYLTKDIMAPQQLSQSASPQTLDILAQVKTGILANMDKGSNEFVIKLSPEGLGEITVKMTETMGKVSLSIITSSQQAQNALTSEISSLREALRPLGAEVSQVITQQEANLSQSFAEGRQGRQQQEQQQGNHLWVPQDEDDLQQQVEYATALKSSLNTYI